MFDGADHLEKGLSPICTLWLDANLPIAHRLTGFSAYNATLARTIYTLLTVSEKKFDVLPTCKHGCMFVGALHFSRMVGECLGGFLVGCLGGCLWGFLGGCLGGCLGGFLGGCLSGQHRSQPAQALRHRLRTRPSPPDAIHYRGVKSCKMWQRVLVRLSG
jgi:uncharacterized membrane protein